MQTFTYEEIREKALSKELQITGLELAYGLAQMAILKAKGRYREKLSRSIRYPKCNLTKIYMKCQILVFQSVRYSRIIY